eukprot:7498436-Ditylum_brightwellii.AAC.1
MNAPAHLHLVEVPPELPLNHAYLVINNTVVTNNLKSILQDIYEATDIRKYIKKASLDDTFMDMIDWCTLG